MNKEDIERAIAESNGSISEAAIALKINKRTLRGRAIKFGLHIVKK